jgi:XTP/dITP diphosphohydrolase
MPDILLATRNMHKVSEVQAILPNIRLLGLDELGIRDTIEETGDTFAENARQKALAYAKLSGLFTIADDSGLCIDYLNGAPGVLSARFLGETTDYVTKNTYILNLLSGVPDDKRQARFFCAVAAAVPDGKGGFVMHNFEGVFEGRIHDRIAGANGFGYDPIFFLPEYGMTSAEIPPELKNRLSHRGKALKAMCAALFGDEA